MSAEEAAQEVRRILHQNDVAETLHYLSTVTRSIEANQHDLRVAIGNSYRDLLAACDGVVGMDKDCRDIMAIEAALEKRGVPAATDVLASADNASVTGSFTAPILPPEWFAKRQHRRRHIAASVVTATSTTAATAVLENKGSITEADKGSDSAAAAAGERALKKAKLHTASMQVSELPNVVLPLPPSALLPFFAAYNTTAFNSNDAKDQGEEKTNTSSTLLGERVRLDDELQALQLQYMEAAASATSQNGAAADMEAVLTALSEGHTVAAAQTPVQNRLPLLSLAQRLHRVQEALAFCKGNGATGSENSRPQLLKAPDWVINFQRRAATLETRLVKLLLVRLRRVADNYAQLAEQRAHLRLLAKNYSNASPSPNKNRQNIPPSTPTHLHQISIEKSEPADTDREEESMDARLRASQMEEKRHTVYVCALLAECHGVLRALCRSPTLLDAFVACAPGVDLPRVPPQPHTGDVAAAASAEAHLLGTAALEKSADPLFHLASLKVREVVHKILCGDASVQQQEHLKEKREFNGASCADPSRWLLALLAVLLLREAQLSAARWSIVSSAAATARAQLRSMERCGSAKPCAAVLPTTPTSTRPGVFANTAFLSSLGLSSLSAPAASTGAFASVKRVNQAAPTPLRSTGFMWASAKGTTATARSASGFATTTAVSAGNEELFNTAWALRCFGGFSSLQRSVADYLDLVEASVKSRSTTKSAGFPAEIDVLHTLEHAWKASAEELRGGGGNSSSDNDVLVGVRAGDAYVGSAHNTGGARTLEELLTWRLTRRGTAAAAAAASPSSISVFSADRTGGNLHDQHRFVSSLGTSGFGLDGGPAPELYSRFSKGVDGRCGDGTPDNQQTSTTMSGFVAATEGTRVAVPAAMRCRAYVTTLRASLHTVAELNTTGSRQTKSLPLAVKNSLLATDVDEAATLSDVDPKTEGSGLSSSLTASLEYMTRELLAPLISSLVVSLARDPVTIMQFADDATQQDPDASLVQPPSTPLCLLLLTSCASAKNGLNASEVKCVGETWNRVNRQQWWEQTQQTVLNEALQRCFTVALHSVSFVERCILRGLVDASRSLTFKSSAVGGSGEYAAATAQQPDTNGVGASTLTGATTTWSFHQVQQIWRMLMQTLHRHTLRSSWDASQLDESSAGNTVGGADDHMPQRRAGHEENKVAANRSVSLNSSAAYSGRAGRACTATGIDWSRFRSSAAGGACSWNATSCAGSPNAHFNTSTRDGLFREEGLEWGQIALLSAQLPLLPTVSATLPHNGEAQQSSTASKAAVLNEEQQAVLMAVLSGLRTRLFPFRQTTASNVYGSEDTILGYIKLNGHAVELLHQCLQTLVTAVRASGTAPSAAFAAVSLPKASQSGNNDNSSHNDNVDASVTSLYTRVVGWLEKSLAHIEAQLSYISADQRNTQPTPSDVIHSYEVALVLRVYDDVLHQLAQPSGIAKAAVRHPYASAEVPTTEGEVMRLREKTRMLYHKTSSLWQHVLMSQYTNALRSHYHALLHVIETASSASGSSTDLQRGEVARHPTGLADSFSWIRVVTAETANRITNSAPAAVVGGGSDVRNHGVSYPAVPTPALTAVVQRTLRLLHQALYGKSTVYGSDTFAIGSGGEEDGEGEGNTYDVKLWTEAGGLVAPYSGVAHQLVTSQERQHVLELLTHATARLFEEELLPLLSSATSDADVNCGIITCDADDVRLQWLMDTLFISSVWSASVENKSALGDSTNSGSSNNSVATCVASAPLQHVALLLEKSCDPIRWRSAAPLVLAAYRRYLSSSAALWVTIGEEDEREEEGDDSETSHAPRKSNTVNAMDSSATPMSLTLATAMKPFVVAGGDVNIAASIERLLQPRDHVERLVLLPIAVSNSAPVAAAAAAVGRNNNTEGAAPVNYLDAAVPSFTIAAPSTAALNPYGQMCASATAASTTSAGSGLRNGTHRVTGSSPLPLHIVSVGGSLFYDGAAAASAAGNPGSAIARGQSGSAAMLGAAGTGASSAAAAASSLWDTTQRGWSQLWGSS